MQQHTKKLLQRSLLLISILLTIWIAYLSLANIKVPIPSINNIDKLEHIVAYGVLSFFWLVALAIKSKKNIYYVVTLCLVYGIILEVLQGVLTSYRTVEFADIIANVIGVILASVFYFWLFKKNIV